VAAGFWPASSGTVRPVADRFRGDLSVHPRAGLVGVLSVSEHRFSIRCDGDSGDFTTVWHREEGADRAGVGSAASILLLARFLSGPVALFELETFV